MTDSRKRKRGAPAGRRRLGKDDEWWDCKRAQFRYWMTLCTLRPDCLDGLRQKVLPLYLDLDGSESALVDALPISDPTEISDELRKLKVTLDRAESDYREILETWQKEWRIEADWIEVLARITMECLRVLPELNTTTMVSVLYPEVERSVNPGPLWKEYQKLVYPSLSFTYPPNGFQTLWHRPLGESSSEARKRIIEEYQDNFVTALDTFLTAADTHCRDEYEVFPKTAFDWLVQRMVPAKKGGEALPPETIRDQMTPDPGKGCLVPTTIRKTTDALAGFLGLTIPRLPSGPRSSS